MMETILNVGLLAILLLCVWSGYKKGIIMGIGGILAIIVALYGANLVSDTFSYDIISAMRPFASGYMESQLRSDEVDQYADEEEEAARKIGILEEMGWDKEELSVQDLLTQYPERQSEFCSLCFLRLGINKDTAKVMADEAVEYAKSNDVDMLTAAVQILCERITFVACFLLSFLLLIILLTVIGNLPNLSYKLPHLDVLNDLGGALLGLVTGWMFCTILVWALKFAGLILGPDTLADGRVSSFFLEHNFMTTYFHL